MKIPTQKGEHSCTRIYRVVSQTKRWNSTWNPRSVLLMPD